jgi:hypothetical protein
MRENEAVGRHFYWLKSTKMNGFISGIFFTISPD